MSNIIGVVFKEGGKTYLFDAESNEVNENDLVVVETPNGLNVVKVIATNVKVNGDSKSKTIVRIANKNDIIILAGKGHETYQEINGKKYPFDERIIVNEIIEKTNKKG